MSTIHAIVRDAGYDPEDPLTHLAISAALLNRHTFIKDEGALWEAWAEVPTEEQDKRIAEAALEIIRKVPAFMRQ